MNVHVRTSLGARSVIVTVAEVSGITRVLKLEPCTDVQLRSATNEPSKASVIVRVIGPGVSPGNSLMVRIVGVVVSVSSEKPLRPAPVVVNTKTSPCISDGSVIFFMIILAAPLLRKSHVTVSPAPSVVMLTESAALSSNVDEPRSEPQVTLVT